MLLLGLGWTPSSCNSVVGIVDGGGGGGGGVGGFRHMDEN